MVIRTHKYANGGAVEEYPKPTYLGAVKDRVKSMLPTKKNAEKAIRKVAPPNEAGKWKSMRDKQIEEAGG